MGFRDTWYPNTVGAMIRLRGEARPDVRGNRLPITGMIETIPILGLLSGPLIDAIKNFQESQDATPGALPIDLVNQDGTIKASAVLLAASQLISVEKYVAGYGDPAQPHARQVDKDLDSAYYTFYIQDSLAAAVDHVMAFRDALRSWQRAVDVSSAAIVTRPFDLTGSLVSEDNATFWLSVRELCVTLDAIAAVPPPVVDYTEAIAEALHKTEEFVGKTAAQIAGEVGKGAGLVAKGFFAEAGLTSLFVAGIAVYLFVR